MLMGHENLAVPLKTCEMCEGAHRVEKCPTWEDVLFVVKGWDGKDRGDLRQLLRSVLRTQLRKR